MVRSAYSALASPVAKVAPGLSGAHQVMTRKSLAASVTVTGDLPTLLTHLLVEFRPGL